MQGKIPSEHSADIKIYPGIDVCKAWLDVYLHPIGLAFRVANTLAGLKALKRRLAGMNIGVIVMEATGKFHRLAWRHLYAAGYRVAVVNPQWTHQFAKAIGQFAKTDRLDARVLALYGESIRPNALPPSPEELEALQELVSARVAALAEQTALSNRRGTSQTAFLKAELGRRLKAIATHIERLEAEIARRVKADPVLQHRVELLLTIPGVGPVTAMAMAIGLPELGSCTGKAASLLAGLAPLADDSGQRTGERYIRGGRAGVRCALYLAALTASRFNPPLAEDYSRLIAKGKEAKVALTAIMRKLVVLANTLITEDRPWQPIQP
jgi:transposase